MWYKKTTKGYWILCQIINGKRIEKYIGNAKAYHKHLKDINRKETELAMLKGNVKTPPMPVDLFNVILADPPWQYDFSETSSRAIENQYPSMPLQQIKGLRLPIAENAALFLWATAPKLREALEVMTAWDFEYRTSAVWDKEKIGMGYWFRGQHELLLVGVKGDFSPPTAELRYSSVIREARTNHSKKPDCIYTMIETMFPVPESYRDSGRDYYLELFKRGTKRPLWAGWGADKRLIK